MCGIIGFNFDDRELLKNMANSIKYRGPDQYGCFIDNFISMASRRLSIIDISTKSKQPIFNEDGTIFIVFNGEIYNYQELRKDLLNKGHRFKSEGDTETIIHAYEEYGEECLSYFNGMFAFAIYDANNRILFLARDRLGIKPLYYYFNHDKFIFASEIKAILEDKSIHRSINLAALNKFMAFRYNPYAQTILNNIFKLKPAHYLVFDLKEKKIKKYKKYWDVNTNNILKKPLEFYIKETQFLLKKSVERRLISDVPLGVFLSGGLDSSAVVAMMHSLNQKNIKTYCVNFGEDIRIKDSSYAKIVSDYFNTDHKEIVIQPDLIKELPKIIWHLDEPLADPAAIPAYLMSEFAKRDSKVVLTGFGGDEIYGGYQQYKFLKFRKQFSQIPAFIRVLLSNQKIKSLQLKLAKRNFNYLSSFGEEGLNRFIEFINSSDDKSKSYLNIVSVFSNKERKKLFTSDILTRMEVDLAKEYKKKYFNNSNEYLTQIFYLELKNFLVDNNLIYLDRTTSAHSIEARVPFLEHKLVEFAFKIPPHLKIKGLNEKYILKKAMAPYLPKQIIKRRKEGFFVPIDSWIKNDLKELIPIILSKKNLDRRGIFDYNYIEKMFKMYDKSGLYYARQLWSLVNFEIWYKIFIEGENYRKIDLSL